MGEGLTVLIGCFLAGVDVDAGWKPLSGVCRALKLFTDAKERRMNQVCSSWHHILCSARIHWSFGDVIDF